MSTSRRAQTVAYLVTRGDRIRGGSLAHGLFPAGTVSAAWRASRLPGGPASDVLGVPRHGTHIARLCAVHAGLTRFEAVSLADAVRSMSVRPPGVGAENPVTLCDLGVLADQAAEPVPPQDPDIGVYSGRTLTPGGRPLAECPMRAMNVVVAGVLAQDQP